MSSSEDNADDVASPRNTNSPRQSDEGISEGIFRQLLVDFAKWYDRLGYINMLKVLYKDHVPIYNELNEATEVMPLLCMLIASGKLSSKNLTILYDTIIVTEQFGFNSISLLPSYQSIKEREVLTFTRHRLKLMRLGMTLTKDDIKTLDGLYNMPLLKNYGDNWSLISDLEQRMKICKEKLDEFTKALPIDSLARKALLEGNSDDGATSSSSHAQKQPDNVDEDTPPISKRPRLKSQDVIIRKYLLIYQRNRCSNASRFTPAIMCNRYHVDIAHMFTDLELLKGDINQPDTRPTTLKEVLGIVKSLPACKVVIEGEAGIGKSTLLRYVAYNWASNRDETFKGKIVFLVNIRDIDNGKTILDTILKQIDLEVLFANSDLPHNPNLIRRFLINHDDEIVLLFDGLDELIDGSESPICYFEKYKMKNSKLMLTSRREQAVEFIKHSDVNVKVEGFSDDNIEKYIKKHFDYMKMPALADPLIGILRFKKMDMSSEVYSMCKNPMLLLAICNIWEDRKHLPRDNADLCKELFRCILNQFNKQASKSQKIHKFEDIPENFVKAMLVLGKCMYEGLKVNQLYINRKNLEGNEETVELALNLGFVYEEAPSSKDDLRLMFSAPHKLIVESLVAFYLYKLCQVAGLKSDRADEMDNVLKPLNENEWDIIRGNTYLHTVKTLVVKFLGANAFIFLKVWITNNWSTYHGLIGYLKHVPEMHMETVEMALIDHMTKTDLEIKAHIDDVCNSMRKYIHNINPDMVVSEDEHFIKLKRRIFDIGRQHLRFDGRFSGELNVKKIFCKEKSAKQRGRLFAHMSIAIPVADDIFERIQHELTLDDVEYLRAEYQRLNIKLEIRYCELYSDSITASYVMYILSNAPQLIGLQLQVCKNCAGKNPMDDFLNRPIIERNIGICNHNGNQSGVIMGIISECTRRDKLKLETLTVSSNNLSDIDGRSLASLLIIAPNLVKLDMENCSLSGAIMNDMIRECTSRGVNLKLETLTVSSNNLSNIDGCSLASLLIIARNLVKLDIENCSLSGVIMNDMIRECTGRGVNLKLQIFIISGNNLSSIDSCLLASLLTIAPKLIELDIENCSLSDVIMNDMITKCTSREFKLDLIRLNISNNNLNNIDGYFLASLFIIAPKLDYIKINNCSLSGVIINYVIKECKSRGVKLELCRLKFNRINLSINGVSLDSLFIIAPKIDLNIIENRHLFDFTMEMLKECKFRELRRLNSSQNDLSNMDDSSLVSLLDVTHTYKIHTGDGVSVPFHMQPSGKKEFEHHTVHNNTSYSIKVEYRECSIRDVII